MYCQLTVRSTCLNTPVVETAVTFCDHLYIRLAKAPVVMPTDGNPAFLTCSNFSREYNAACVELTERLAASNPMGKSDKIPTNPTARIASAMTISSNVKPRFVMLEDHLHLKVLFPIKGLERRQIRHRYVPQDRGRAAV